VLGKTVLEKLKIRRRIVKKSFVSIILLMMLTIVGFICIDAKADTIATFDDPAVNGTTALFTVDFTAMTLNGGWAKGNTGLLLHVPYSGNNFTDAWFAMTEVQIINAFGDTSGGEINFYENNTSTDPLITLNFESGYVDNYNFGADAIFVTDNVTITGSEIMGKLSEEQFAFSFANLAKLPDHTEWTDGFTATAAFTSSAIPEPATIALLVFGISGITCVKRKK
jgi:hypothetical protein